MSEKPEPNADPELLIRELSGRIGKYEIMKPLGKGAMGMVYLAHDTVLERDVALKVMVANIADDPELKQRFEREAKAVARMTHPNVVNVFDLGSHSDGSPFIAMELLKGMDLQKAIRSGPPMSLERKVATIVQVLAGLAHAHQAGIVHRDIKPANIFISSDGSVKIMDFGVARLTTASMTGTGNIVGTADYMSPEQVKGAKVDGRSDVFGVGCMLYELLAGRRPFHSENLMAIFYKITHEEPAYDAIPVGPEYEALLPTLRKALAKSLDDRYQTAYEFAVDLREYLKSHAESATGRHALEGLVDLEAPPFPPEPLTDAAAGPTLVSGEEETGLVTGMTAGVGPTVRGRPAPPTRASPPAPQRGEATVSGHAPTRVAASAAPAAARAAGGTVVRPSPSPRPVSRTHPALYAVLGGMGAALVAAGGYIYWSRSQQAPPLPSTSATLTSAPSEPPATMAQTAAPTSTPAATLPPATVVDAAKPAAASLRGAQAAFARQDYERAIGLAQTALREDPGDAAAQKVLDNAFAGQAAGARFRTAEAALAGGDLKLAASEIDAARAGAPWDSRGSSLLQRLQEAQRAQQESETKAQQDAQQRAQQQAQQQAQQKAQKLATQVSDMLSRAEGALGEQRYDAALSLYDQVLALEPQNQRASIGRSGALSARALSQAAQGGALRPGKVFSLGATQAQGAESSSTGGGVPGFEDSTGVNVKKGTQAANLPGKINIDVDPSLVKPGERYTVRISMRNEGDAPIQVQEMIVKTTVNGRAFTGPVPPLVKDVAPQQKAMLREVSDLWKEDTTSWRMEVTVRTARGETYKNDVTWK